MNNSNELHWGKDNDSHERIVQISKKGNRENFGNDTSESSATWENSVIFEISVTPTIFRA